MEEWDERQHRRPPQGPALAVPRGDPADRRVRQEIRKRQPARGGRRLHPGVRRRPLVGAAAAQPDRAAAQGPAAVRPRGHGHLGALPAAVVAASPASARSARARVHAGDLRRGQRRSPRTGSPRERPAMSRVRRPRQAARALARRRAVHAEVGPVAHGGHCVVRLPTSPSDRVVFTRHALPGERVVVEITEGTDGDRFWRGDAVEVLAASPDRVAAPCPVAGPGLCGGCDFQHVALPAQRASRPRWCASSWSGSAAGRRPAAQASWSSAVPGDDDGLRWRTRHALRDAPTDGRRGMRKHRSHDVVPVDDCLIAHPDAEQPPAGRSSRDRARARDVRGRGRRLLAGAPGCRRRARRRPSSTSSTRSRGSGCSTSTPASGSSPASSPTRSARTGWSRSRATAAACRHARANLRPAACGRAARRRRPGARRRRTTSPSTSSSSTRPARAPSAPSWSRSSTDAPRAVAYVACDPAALARDVAIFAEHGYRLTRPARLRPVPDDAPRRMRRAAGENRL